MMKILQNLGYFEFLLPTNFFGDSKSHDLDVFSNQKFTLLITPFLFIFVFLILSLQTFSLASSVLQNFISQNFYIASHILKKDSYCKGFLCDYDSGNGHVYRTSSQAKSIVSPECFLFLQINKSTESTLNVASR